MPLLKWKDTEKTVPPKYSHGERLNPKQVLENLVGEKKLSQEEDLQGENRRLHINPFPLYNLFERFLNIFYYMQLLCRTRENIYNLNSCVCLKAEAPSSFQVQVI